MHRFQIGIMRPYRFINLAGFSPLQYILSADDAFDILLQNCAVQNVLVAKKGPGDDLTKNSTLAAECLESIVLRNVVAVFCQEPIAALHGSRRFHAMEQRSYAVGRFCDRF